MSDNPQAPRVIAVRALLACAPIDGGDTIDVRFAEADGRTIAVLIPRKVFTELAASELAGSASQAQRARE